VSEDAPARPFLELIEATLASQGKTKTWLAKRAGVSRAAINNWRAQPRTPQASSVLAVADTLGIGHDKALRLAGLPSAGSTAPDDATDLSAFTPPALMERIHRLTSEIDRLTDELHRRVKD
jgi:transcriptional regulator with XRE-family HTH domain